jgi:hypothetical protein
MFKSFLFGVIALCAVACGGAGDDSESTMAMVEEAQTFGGPGFGNPDPQLVPKLPGDTYFFVVSTCTATTSTGQSACFGTVIAECKADGGAGIVAKLKGSPDETGRYNISGKCAIRAAE